VNFRLGVECGRFGHGRGGALYDFDGAFDSRLFFRKVLVPDLLGEFFGDRVGRHAHVDAFAAHFFNESLRVEL